MFFNVPEEVSHSSGIYKISNSIDDKIYVGRTSDFKRRFYSHRRSFCYLNDKIKVFIYRNPDAEFYFQNIEVTNNLKSAEEFWIRKLKSVENGFNIFHCDEEYLRRRDHCIYYKEKTPHEIDERIKIKAAKIALKERQRKEKEKKKIEREERKIEREKESKISKKYQRQEFGVLIVPRKYNRKYILINGKKYDFLGNRIR